MKKLISLLLVAMMALSLCMVSANADEPVEIEIAVSSLGNGWPADLKDDFIYQKILEDTGVSMKLVLVDDFYTAVNARITGGNTPDMIKTDVDHMITWVRMEALKDMTPYLDNELANYKSWLGSTEMTACYVDGKLYALPQIYDGSKHQYCVTIRQDWLDALGLQMPTTVQELYDVAYAFTYNDPDKNGLNDTVGLTATKGMYVFDTIMGSFDTVLSNQIIIRDGKVTNSLLQPRMVEALEMCKKFFDDGLLDPDMFSSNSQVKAHVIACNTAVAAMPWSNILKAAYVAQYKEVNPEADYTWIGAMSQGGDACYGVAKYDKYAGDHAVINADVTDKELEAIFKVLEYMCTEEGMMLVYAGVENEHWTRNEDGSIVLVPGADKLTNYTHMYQLLGRNDAFYLQVKFPEASEATAFGLATPRYIYYNTSVVLPDDFNLADMENYVKTQMLAFIKGERPISEYETFVQELNDNYAFADYMKLATEQLVEQGLANE